MTVGTAPGGTPAPVTPVVVTPTTPTTPVVSGVDQVKTEDTKQPPHAHAIADGEFCMSREERNMEVTLRDLRYEDVIAVQHSVGSMLSPCYHNAMYSLKVGNIFDLA